MLVGDCEQDRLTALEARVLSVENKFGTFHRRFRKIFQDIKEMRTEVKALMDKFSGANIMSTAFTIIQLLVAGATLIALIRGGHI